MIKYGNKEEFWKKHPDHDDSENAPYPKVISQFRGNHATTLVGFDYSINSNNELEGHFLLRNSWGDNPIPLPVNVKSTFGGNMGGYYMVNFNDWPLL